MNTVSFPVSACELLVVMGVVHYRLNLSLCFLPYLVASIKNQLRILFMRLSIYRVSQNVATLSDLSDCD